MKPSESKAIIQRPDQYLATQAQTLDERFKGLTLPPGTEEIITSGATKKLIRDKLLGLFKVGEVISTILNWNDDIDTQIRAAKRDYLISEYFHQNEQNALAISDLKKFLSSGQGNTLFNKIMRILDDSPPDEELVAHLSAALRYIVVSDFVSLFEEHKYALSQLEQISPQALAILSDQISWPEMALSNGYQASGVKVQSDWLQEFTIAYTNLKGISDVKMQSRVRYSISELTNRRIIEAHLVGQSTARCTVTDIGALLIPYINK